MRNFLERGMRMDDIQNQNIDDLLQQENSVKLELEAFKEIKITRKNRVMCICSICFFKIILVRENFLPILY